MKIKILDLSFFTLRFNVIIDCSNIKDGKSNVLLFDVKNNKKLTTINTIKLGNNSSKINILRYPPGVNAPFKLNIDSTEISDIVQQIEDVIKSHYISFRKLKPCMSILNIRTYDIKEIDYYDLDFYS